MVQGRGISAEPQSFLRVEETEWESGKSMGLESDQLHREKTLVLEKVSLQIQLSSDQSSEEATKGWGKNHLKVSEITTAVLIQGRKQGLFL